jgi:hypothetical protein
MEFSERNYAYTFWPVISVLRTFVIFGERWRQAENFTARQHCTQCWEVGVRPAASVEWIYSVGGDHFPQQQSAADWHSRSTPGLRGSLQEQSWISLQTILLLHYVGPTVWHAWARIHSQCSLLFLPYAADCGRWSLERKVCFKLFALANLWQPVSHNVLLWAQFDS